jgi:prepilin-type N-terminal cleavage/methylation domain-containing protein
MVMEWHCAHYLYTKELTNFTGGGIKYPPTFLKPMKRNGFTLIEMLITLTVLSIIVMIALPMHAMRAKRPRQAEAKVQLMAIKDAEEKYKLQQGSYTVDTSKISNWQPSLGRYQFKIKYADSVKFVAQADGDLNNDRIYDDDIWTIDQNGKLAKIR